jgi:integrase
VRTRSGLPKGCCWNMDRENGKRRVRFRDRRAGFSTYLYGTPWSEEFMRAYAAAQEGSKAKSATIVGAKRTVAGTINALIVSYYASTAFKDIKASTQANRRGILERFRSEYGDLPVKGLTRGMLEKLMGDRSNTPMAANNMAKVLRYLLDHAVALNMIVANPTIGIKRYRNKSSGWHTWTDEEVAQFQARHPSDTRAGLALALLIYTGQRRGDVVTMGRQHVTGDLIAVEQEKTGASLMVPLHPDLMRVLDALPKNNMTFLVTERGAPFTSAGFGNWFRDRCDEADLPHCTAHGLRHAAATRLANIGCTDEEIMAITGHRSRASLAVYTRGADQRRLARQAMAKLTNSEQKNGPAIIPLDQKQEKAK